MGRKPNDNRIVEKKAVLLRYFHKHYGNGRTYEDMAEELSLPCGCSYFAHYCNGSRNIPKSRYKAIGEAYGVNAIDMFENVDYIVSGDSKLTDDERVDVEKFEKYQSVIIHVIYNQKKKEIEGKIKASIQTDFIEYLKVLGYDLPMEISDARKRKEWKKESQTKTLEEASEIDWFYDSMRKCIDEALENHRKYCEEHLFYKQVINDDKEAYERLREIESDHDFQKQYNKKRSSRG